MNTKEVSYLELENIKKSLLDRIKDLSYTGNNKAELSKYLQMYYEVKNALSQTEGIKPPEQQIKNCNVHPYVNLYRYNTENYPLAEVNSIYRIETRGTSK